MTEIMLPWVGGAKLSDLGPGRKTHPLRSGTHGRLYATLV
jgi:hypothetical protein